MTTIDPVEIQKFDALKDAWWDQDGPLKTLHDINPVRLDFVNNLVPIKGLRILDVGCGGGIFATALAKAGATVVGIDASESAITVAKSVSEAQDLPIEYQATAIESFSSAPFDIITCMELLEHVDNFEEILVSCARLLKPEGHAFFSTINRTPTAFLLGIVLAEYVLGLLPRQTHEYQKFIKPSELAMAARAEGWEVTRIAGIAYHPFLRKASLQKSVAVNYIMAISAADNSQKIPHK